MKVTKYALPGIEKNKLISGGNLSVCHVTCPYISRHLKQKLIQLHTQTSSCQYQFSSLFSVLTSKPFRCTIVSEKQNKRRAANKKIDSRLPLDTVAVALMTSIRHSMKKSFFF